MNLKSVLCFLADSKPFTKVLQSHVIPHLGNKWFELGIQLLEPDQEQRLRLIRSNYEHDVKKCCSEMFYYWLETHPDANWYQLAEALKSPAVELNTLAADIEKNFTSKQIGNVDHVHCTCNSCIVCPSDLPDLYTHA